MASMSRSIDRSRRKRAVAYARFSSNNQREESIDAQLRAIREYCEKEDIELVEVFTDEAISGKTDNREDFQNMINLLMKKRLEADFVLVHKFNRFARSKLDSAIYKKKLKEVGIKVVSVTQKIDDSPEGAMMESVLEALDQYYSENLALEVKKGLRENALKARSVGGKKVLGLSVDDNGHYYPNDEAPIVKRIFEEYANGIPNMEICSRLNAEGIRNQYGRTFNPRTIYDMLRNEKYIGNYILKLSDTETIRVDGGIENPIISKELWDRVIEIRNNPTRKKYHKQKRIYHLTGKIKCLVCGLNYSGAGAKKKKNGEFVYYKCAGKKHKNGCDNPSLNKEWFEGEVLKAVIDNVFSDEMIDKISDLTYQEVETARKTPTVQIKAVENELNQVKKKQDRLAELYIDGSINKSIFDDKNSELKARRSFLEGQIEKNRILTRDNALTKDDIKDFIEKYVTELRELERFDDVEFMKTTLDVFVKSVEVSKKEVKVSIHTDYNRMNNSDIGGDIVWNGGLNHTIARLNPIEIKATFKRKKGWFDSLKK